jgi:hypothetical protein
MENSIEEASKLREIESTVDTIKSGSVNISPSDVIITNNVKEAFKERANKFRRPEPSEETIKSQISKIVSDRLKHYYENIADHPSMGFPQNWKVEQVKVDYIDKRYAFAVIVLNTDENNRWFIFFDANQDSSKNIDPHYFDIKTRHFDINKFPMEEIVKSPVQAKGKAIELTEKQFEDTIRSQRVGRISSKL